MQDGIDLITALASHPETARRLTTKLYQFFVSETNPPDPGFIDSLASVYLQNDTAIAPVLRVLFTLARLRVQLQLLHAILMARRICRAGDERSRVDGVLGRLGLSPLINMNQILFEPPDVAGWTLGRGWFSTGAMLARMNFASTLAANQKFNLATAAAGARSSPQAVVDFMLTRLTPMLDSRTYADLSSYAASGGAWTGSASQLQAKTSGLAHLIVGSPEYQVT